jgi:hypothetical protein
MFIFAVIPSLTLTCLNTHRSLRRSIISNSSSAWSYCRPW